MIWSPLSSRSICWVGTLAVLSAMAAAPHGLAQDSEPESEKALKYHGLLVSRPEPGYLFDRFYNTWLDESTVDALEKFLTSHAQQTRTTPDQLLLAFFYVKKGDDVAALEQFQQALAANPASAATWYYKALVEARTLDFDSAIADLKKAREQSPDDKLAVQVDKQLGKLLVRNRKTAEALAVWQALIKAHPDDDELCEDLIDLHIEEGLLKEASQLTETLIARTKDPYLTVMRRLRLGDIRNRAGDREQAIADYTSALDEVGNESWLEREILAQMEQVHRREDDIAGLKRLYDGLVTKYPKRIAIRRRQAQLLVEQGDHDPVIAAFREVMKLTPGDRATREEFVQILAKIGKHDDAVTELKAICEQFPKDAELRFRLANLLHDAKKSEEATAAVQEYLAVSDGSEYAFLRAARLLERFESKGSAAKVYAEMAGKFTDSPSAQEAYAAFLYSSDNKDEALKRWRSLAEKADVAQVLHVARALGVRNEHAAALDMLVERQAEFAKEPLYLGQLVSTAFALKKYDEAIPWALSRVDLAESVNDLEAAIDQAAAIIERAEKLEEVSKHLESRERRSIPESCLLAELLERTGDSGRADAVLQGPAANGNLLALSEQIRIFSQRREWSAAADATRRILDLPDGRKSLYVRRLVELYQRDFQLEEALKWIDPWKQLSPGSTTPWVTEARMLSGLGKSEDALKVLRTAVLRFEDDEELRVKLAEYYTEAEKPADAERIYWQLYEQTEDLSDKLRWAQELAKLAQQQGTVQQLVDNFNERIAGNRRSIVPLLSLSEVYRQTDDYEGRRRALTAASKIKPDDIYLLQQIARVAEQDGDWKAAVATLERAIPLDKTNRTREQIAQLHLRNGDEDTGLAMLIDLTSGADADPRTLEAFGDTLCAMQEWERAADFLQKRLVDFPDDYRLRYLMAVAMEEAGQSDAAFEQFIQLLDDQQELPSKTKKGGPAGQQNLSTNYYDMLRELLPAQAGQWFEVLQQRYTAYSHRQRRGMVYSISPAGGAVRSAIQLPPNVEMVRPMAMSHALGVIGTMEEARQQDAARVLEANGIQHAEIWSRVDPMRGDFTPALVEMLEKDPDDESALAILVMQRVGSRDASLAPHCRKAVEKFRESRPQLALMAAVQAGAQGADDAVAAEAPPKEQAQSAPDKYLEEALQIAVTLEKPNPIVVMAITQSLGGIPGGQGQSQVDEAYRQKFSQLLVKWYPTLNNSPWGSYAFYMVVGSLGQNEDPAAYVQFLDEEVGRFQVGGSRSSRSLAAQMGMSRGNQQPFITPLTFPPTELAEFPGSVLMLFSANQDFNPFGSRLQAPGQTEESSAKLKPLLPKVKSPILRILLAHSVDDAGMVDDGIAKLLSAKAPNVDAYLLAASRAAEKEDHQGVIELLGKARYLPMNPAVRQKIDAAVVAAVVALKAGSKPLAPELLEAGQQASLRLRRARLDAQQRNELIAAMEDLGLKKEAKKLDELASQTTNPSVAMSTQVIYSGSARLPNTQDRVSKLVAEGKREEAAKLLATEVSAQVQQAMGNPGMGRSFSYQYRELKRRIDGLGLADAVAKALDPGETQNYRRINEYAMALEIFGRDDEARAQYQRVLKLRPKDDFARMPLIFLLAASDPSAAAAEIKQLTPSSRDAFGQMLGEQFQDYEASLAERIAVGGVAVEFVKTLKPGDVTQPHWIENIVNSLGRQMHTNRGPGLPSLYQRVERGDSRRQRSQASDEVAAQRAQVHRDLCLALLDNADFARTGFRHLLAAASAKGEKTDEFAQRAQKLLLDEAAARPGRTNAGNLYQVYYSGDSQEERFASPEEFLASRAWQAKDWSLIDDTILPKLTGGRMRQSREQLERMSALYRCESNEFIARAEDAVRDARATSQQGQNEGLAIVVDVWAARDLDVDLREMVLKQLKLDAGQQNHYRVPTYLTSLIEGAADKWDRGRQLEFLDEVATIYIAPPGKRNDFLQKNYQQNQINWGTPSGRIYVYKQFMDQLCQQGDLLFTVLEHLQQYDQPLAENLEYRVREEVNRAVSKGGGGALRFLERSPWLQDLPQFQALAVGGTGENAPLTSLVQQLVRQNETKAKLRELLSERQKNQPTFGGGLILACLEQPEKADSVLDYLAENIDAIRALSEEQQVDLANGVYDLVRRDRFVSKDLSAGANVAKEWLEAKRAGKSQSVLVRLEKAKRLEELGIQYGNVDDFLRQSVADLIRTDTSAAVKAMHRLGDLSREAQRRGEWHMYFGSGNSTDGWLLQQAMYGVQEKDWSTYNFVADVVRNDKGRHIEASAATQVISDVISRALDRVPKLANGQVAPIDVRVRAMYEEFGAALAGRPASLFFQGFRNQVGGQLSEKDCDKIRAWAREEAKGGKFPALAADLDAVVALIATEKGAARNQKFAPGERRPMADYHEHFAKLLDDGELPLSWRLVVAEFLAQRQAATLPIEVAQKMVPLYSESLAAKVPITGSQNDWMMAVVLSLKDEASAKESVANWGDKWAGRYLGPVRPQTSNQRDYERLDEPGNSLSICNALEAYLATGNTERATTLLRKYDGHIGSMPQSLAILVRANQPTEAAQLIRSNWPTLQLEWPSTPKTRFDVKFAALVPAVYEQLDRNDLRYFAELFFASAFDVDPKSQANDGLEPDATNRDERLSKLAERYSEIEFADAALRKRSLVILSLCKATRDSVADQLAAEYKVENVVSAIQSQENQTAITQETQLAACHLNNRLRQGDSQPLVELLSRLNRNPDGNDYQFGQRLMPFITCLRDALNESGQPWSAEECTAIAAQMRDFFKNRDYIYFNDYQAFNSLFAAMHSRVDNRDTVQKWWKELPENSRSQMKNRGFKDDIWKLGLRLVGPPTPENVEARVQYVEGVLGFAVDLGWVRWNRGQQYHLVGIQNTPLFAGVVNSGLLTKEELTQHGEALVGDVNNVPLVTAAWAEWLLANQEFERAAANWRWVIDIELKPDDKKPSEQKVGYVFKLARALQGARKFDEAQAALASLEGKEIPGPERGNLTRIKKQLEEEVKNSEKTSQPDDEKKTAPAAGDEPADSRPAPPATTGETNDSKAAA